MSERTKPSRPSKAQLVARKHATVLVKALLRAQTKYGAAQMKLAECYARLAAECAVPEGMVLVPRKLLDAAQDVREEFGDPQYHSYVTDKQIALCDLLRDYGDDAECERNKEK